MNTKEVPVGLAVRICGFHPQGPGSTPGLGIFLNFAPFVKVNNANVVTLFNEQHLVRGFDSKFCSIPKLESYNIFVLSCILALIIEYRVCINPLYPSWYSG